MALLSVERFWDGVRSGRPMLSDGAIGSELIGQGIAAEAVLRANLTDEPSVRSLHEAYVASGAQFITSNTFGLRSTPAWSEECRAGVDIAVRAAFASPREIGEWLSLPPCVVASEQDTLCSLFGSASTKPPMLLIETCTSLRQARAAVRAAAALAPEVLAITAYFREDGKLPDGTAPEEFVKVMEGDGAQVLGANCGITPELFIEITSRMRGATTAPLLIQPSAGLPRQDGAGYWLYPVEPERFARVALRLADAGANIIGGCCGATPRHIAAAYSQLDLHRDFR